MTRCKCDFPTIAEARRLNPQMPEEVYSRSHRAHHDDWDARRNLNPDTDLGQLLCARSVAMEHELRLARLEAAVVSLGVELPAMGPADAVLRQTATGRTEGS